MITVFTKPGCVQCRFTFAALDKAGINYTAVDVTTDTAGRDAVVDLGYQQLPVVVVDDGIHWSGLRTERITALATGKVAA